MNIYSGWDVCTCSAPYLSVDWNTHLRGKSYTSYFLFVDPVIHICDYLRLNSPHKRIVIETT